MTNYVYIHRRYYKYIGTLHLCLYRCVYVYARYGRDVCLAKDEYSFTELVIGYMTRQVIVRPHFEHFKSVLSHCALSLSLSLPL